MYTRTLAEQKEFEHIKTNSTGGLDQRQVQLGLRGLFRGCEDIYVPLIETLSEALPLENLDPEKKYAAFSIDVSSQEMKHQVAVWIKRGPPVIVTILDSQPRSDPLREKRIHNQLQRLLGNNYEIEETIAESPFPEQKDEWSCGVYVMANCLDQYQAATGQARNKSFDREARLEEYYDQYLREIAVDKVLGMDPKELPPMDFASRDYKHHSDSPVDIISMLSTELNFLLNQMEKKAQEKLLVDIMRARQIYTKDHDFRNYLVKDILALDYDMGHFENITNGHWMNQVVHNFSERLDQLYMKGAQTSREREAIALKAAHEDREQKILNFFPELNTEKQRETVNKLSNILALRFIEKYAKFIRKNVRPSDLEKIFSEIISNKNIRANKYGAISVFRMLEDGDNFIIRHFAPKVESLNDLVNLLPVLSEEMRKCFLQKNEHLIHNSHQLAKVLESLPKDKQLAFAQKYEGLIQDGEQLAAVLDSLSQTACIEFANGHYRIIEDYNLVKVLMILPQPARLAFAHRCRRLVTDYFDLVKVLESLPERDRFGFIQAHKKLIALIQNSTQLIEVIKILFKPDRLAFAEQYKILINDDKQLARVIESLSEPDRRVFIEKDKSKPLEEKISSGAGLFKSNPAPGKLVKEFKILTKNWAQKETIVSSTYLESYRVFHKGYIFELCIRNDGEGYISFYGNVENIENTKKIIKKVKDACQKSGVTITTNEGSKKSSLPTSQSIIININDPYGLIILNTISESVKSENSLSQSIRQFIRRPSAGTEGPT